MKLMQKSGCISALIGFESLNRDNLVQMRKSWNVKYNDYQTSVRVFQEAGIMIYGTFVFGYDQDTPDSFDAAVDFAIENKFYLANFNPLTPTPGRICTASWKNRTGSCLIAGAGSSFPIWHCNVSSEGHDR